MKIRDIPFRPEEVEVVSGLADGERVATLGMAELRDGSRVRFEETPVVADTETGETGS